MRAETSDQEKKKNQGRVTFCDPAGILDECGIVRNAIESRDVEAMNGFKSHLLLLQIEGEGKMFEQGHTWDFLLAATGERSETGIYQGPGKSEFRFHSRKKYKEYSV